MQTDLSSNSTTARRGRPYMPSLLIRLLCAVGRWVETGHQRQALDSLDAALLRDIGLRRDSGGGYHRAGNGPDDPVH